MIHHSHANTVQPAATPQDVPADGRVGEKIDKGMTDDTEHVDLNFVAIRLEATICRPESCEHAGDQSEAEFSRVCTLEQAIRCAGVHTRDQIGECFAAPQENGDCNTGIALRIGVNPRERELMHCLPAAEGLLAFGREVG